MFRTSTYLTYDYDFYQQGKRVAEGAHNFTMFLLCNFIGVGWIV